MLKLSGSKMSMYLDAAAEVKKNSSGHEIANANFYAVRLGSYQIQWNNAK